MQGRRKIAVAGATGRDGPLSRSSGRPRCRTAPHSTHPPPPPPRYKLALLTWAGAYGVITMILGLLGRTMAGWPLVLRTLLISVLMVTALTWIVVPALTRLFRAWLLAATPAQVPASRHGR